MLRMLVLLTAAACAGNDTAAMSGEDTRALTHQIATSATHSCVIRQQGLYCWGRNARGELGDGTTTDSVDAVRAEVAGTDVVDVATHSGRTCVRRSSGEVACWGANEHGQIGDGTRDDSLVPVPPVGITDVAEMAVDDNSTCVVHGAQRQVSCWGESSTISPDKGYLIPALIPELSRVKQLVVGAFGSYCALDDTSSVKCWRIKVHESDNAVLPVSAGLLFQRCLASPSCKAAYKEAVSQVVTVYEGLGLEAAAERYYAQIKTQVYADLLVAPSALA